MRVLSGLHDRVKGWELSLEEHHRGTYGRKKCYCEIDRISVKKNMYLTREALNSLTQAFVHCRLDYCNSALAGVAKVYLQKLQSVQNMAARMVSGVHQSEHITSVLEDLHQLPVSQTVVFKMALLVWKCVHAVAPAYLSDLCIPVTAISGRQHLRSAVTGTLLVPCTRTTKFCSQRTSHGTVCHQHCFL